MKGKHCKHCKHCLELPEATYKGESIYYMSKSEFEEMIKVLEVLRMFIDKWEDD